MTSMRASTILATALVAVAAYTAPVLAGHYSAHGHHGHPYGHHQYQGHAGPDYANKKHLKLGVKISDLPQAELDSMGLEYGVGVKSVKPGSVADQAGLQSGDVITSVADRPVYSTQRLQYLVKKARGATSIGLSRDGEALQLQATFAAPGSGRAMLGVRVQQMTGDLKQAFGTDGESGVLISRVIEDSAASQAGLQASRCANGC